MENLQGTAEEAETGSCDSAGEVLASLWGKEYLGILWLRLLRKNNLTMCPDYELDSRNALHIHYIGLKMSLAFLSFPVCIKGKLKNLR